MKKFILFFIVMVLMGTTGYAQELSETPELGERLTQEEFAVELVKSMNMEGWLPTSALAGDCVLFLERLGVTPLTGWNNKAYLSQEDYLVILAKVNGKESMVYERANDVEKKNIEVINKKWEEANSAQGRSVSLTELLNNREYFPEGPPKSPYGVRYQDKNNDYKVDPPFLPVVALTKLRARLSKQ